MLKSININKKKHAFGLQLFSLEKRFTVEIAPRVERKIGLMLGNNIVKFVAEIRSKVNSDCVIPLTK